MVTTGRCTCSTMISHTLDEGNWWVVDSKYSSLMKRCIQFWIFYLFNSIQFCSRILTLYLLAVWDSTLKMWRSVRQFGIWSAHITTPLEGKSLYVSKDKNSTMFSIFIYDVIWISLQPIYRLVTEHDFDPQYLTPHRSEAIDTYVGLEYRPNWLNTL